MQKTLALAIVAGALIIGAALIYHGHQLTLLSGQLQATQKQTASLDTNLQNFSIELPKIIQAAGKDAGRQAVQGMAEEAVQLPRNMLKSVSLPGTSNILQHLVSPLSNAALLTNKDLPLIRFDIPQPVVNIEILPGVKELPNFSWLSSLLPWLLEGSKTNGSALTNQLKGEMEKPAQSAGP